MIAKGQSVLNGMLIVYPPETKQYIMGIDLGGYDHNAFCICVTSKCVNTGTFVVEYQNTLRDEAEYLKEVARISEFYKCIPIKEI